MWQGAGSTININNKSNLSCYSPRVQAVSFGFSLLYSRGGGSTAAVVTLDTVADESRKMTDGVARAPSRLCSRDGKICCYGGALSTIFLLAFVPCFLLFVFRFSFLSFFLFLHPGIFIFFVSLRRCSSHLLLSGSTYFIVMCSFCLLCSLYRTPSRNSFVFCSFNTSKYIFS